MKHIYSILIGCLIALSLHAQTKPADTLTLADPTIFYDKGQYYLYGTGSNRGFEVYRSADLNNWKGPVGKIEGHAMLKGQSYGRRGFWAPQIFKHKDKYYMAYTADEQVAIAESDSPLGPFTQKTVKAISGPGKQIDPYIFKDTDGKLYLYHVRLQKGNRIFVARLKDDLSDIDTTTTKECISAQLRWENEAKSDWPVSEGPTVVKHNGLYYMLYSCNDFRNINYSIGYATATSPMGPWVKSKSNPILTRQMTGVNGTGHGDLFADGSGQLFYVFHTHQNNLTTGRRKTAIIKMAFSKDKPSQLNADQTSFRFLFK
ncbi:glycoside hydrolase family 43 protein [Mucilaginibacter myungsuensis]|uniref:Glycoside hydrolase family 43 protein n=1 Tax=Mucilaginibacter myungsuensis TaxID=649104 RepID=A0A929PVZ9_9SPHI|nr:glycoside hydrolase family 43 protein [Mucilaginibacter myungsuensis]MBE9660845.1 glycoside hydrolase family 43 protein [Mucilaginibacter myungsuensis]MDN3600892.1 glycoside hydrolase family 43 protein [Mucilaginibacter myungsuensis]